MLQSISATRKGEATATDNLQALAYAINMTTGCSVDFVAGPIEVTGRDGQTRYVNGFFDPETRRIVARVDSGRYTPQQITKHEEFHALARLYPKLVKNVRDNVLQHYGRPELKNIIRTYQEKRRGNTRNNEMLAFGFLVVIELSSDNKEKREQETGSKY